jgi:hypothetical protein
MTNKLAAFLGKTITYGGSQGAGKTHAAFVDALQKAGARNSSKDRENLRKAHDAIADMADGAHCGDGPEKALKLAKANARNSKADMAKIEECHGILMALGAECPGMKKAEEKSGEGWPPPRGR